jgi:hypothetical protein
VQLPRGTAQVRFKGIAGSSWQSDMCVDNIVVANMQHAGQYMHLDTSKGRTGETSYLQSPTLLAGIRSMSFAYQVYDATADTLYTESRAGKAGKWTPTGWHVTGSRHQGGRTAQWSVAVTNIPGGTTQVRFTGRKGDRKGSNPANSVTMMIDSVSFSASTVKLCDVLTAPANGGMGNCVNALLRMSPGMRCQPTCNSGYDVSGPTVCRNTSTLVTPVCQKWSLKCGAAACEYDWTGIGSSTHVHALTSHPRFPQKPNVIHKLMSGTFQMKQTGDDLGAMLEGFVKAPITGTYTFSTESDDASEVWAATQPSTLSGLRKVVELTGCCRKVSGTTALTWSGGKSYYIMGLVKEGRGGEYLRVGMRGVVQSSSRSRLRCLQTLVRQLVPARTAPRHHGRGAHKTNLRCAHCVKQATVWSLPTKPALGHLRARSVSC